MLSERNIFGLLKEFFRYLKKPIFHNLQRFKDFQALLKEDPTYHKLHQEFYEIIEKSKDWEGYDYNEGYFYQSFPMGKIHGLRDNKARIEEYSLLKEVKDKQVLDIGCNMGFLDCELSASADHIDGFDVNPYLIEIANKAKIFFSINNCHFFTTSFEDFESASLKYDVIFSFANHSTYDGKTKHTLQEYINKIYNLLKEDGVLLLESHAPAYEKNFSNVLSIVEEKFNIASTKIQSKGTYLDINRTFIKALKK